MSETIHAQPIENEAIQRSFLYRFWTCRYCTLQALRTCGAVHKSQEGDKT